MSLLELKRHERVALAAINHLLRVRGVPGLLIPKTTAQMLVATGFDLDEILKILREVRSMADWAPTWERAAARAGQRGQGMEQMAYLYVAQRLMVEPTAYKQELYAQMVDLYRTYAHEYELDGAALEQTPPMYVQSPKVPQGTVIIVPGVMAAKEEMHTLATWLLQRGWRVARIDNPGCGERPGTLREAGTSYVRDAAVQLRGQYTGPVHAIGFSLGGLACLKSAQALDRIVTVGAPCEPVRYAPHLPGYVRLALAHIVGTSEPDELTLLMDEFQVRAADIVGRPVLALHGGRDHTIPPREAQRIAELNPLAVSLIYPKEPHSCFGVLDDIAAQALAFFIAQHGECHGSMSTRAVSAS